MNIVVTGANGYVGRQVVKCFLESNISISLLVRSNTKIFEKNNKIKIFTVDLSNINDNIYEQLEKPDILIHLAWGGLPNYSSLHHFETELYIQYNFLKKMIIGGLKKIFITGTCFEYGLQEGCLMPSTVTKPENPYGYAKDSLRKQLIFLKNEYDFNFIWARLFYIFGEDQPITTLYGSLINKIRTGGNSFDLSAGEQLRDYLHVKQVAKLIFENSLNIENTKTINLSSGVPISVRKFVESIVDSEKSSIELNFGVYPYSSNEPMEFWGGNP